MTSRPASRLGFLCSYTDDRVMKERGLRPNAAGANRARRLGNALRVAGERPVLVSPALQARMRLLPLWQPARVRRAGRVPVIYGPKLGPPPLCHLASIGWTAGLFLRRLGIKRAGKMAIYNYLPTQLLTLGVLKLASRFSVLMDLEDLAFDRLADIPSATRGSLPRRLVDAACQAIGVRMIDAAVVPAAPMLTALPKHVASLVVHGCLDSFASEPTKLSRPRPTVFYAAPLEVEKGVRVLGELVSCLASDPSLADVASALEFNVCGAGSQEAWLRREVASAKEPRVTIHGFTTSARYRELLDASDICLSLQPVEGKEASLTMPSKVAEFMAAGKVVVASAVGDVEALPADCLRVYRHDDPGEVARQLADLVRNRSKGALTARRALDYAREHFSAERVGSSVLDLMSGSSATADEPRK